MILCLVLTIPEPELVMQRPGTLDELKKLFELVGWKWPRLEVSYL